MSDRDQTDDAADVELFRQAVSDVTPLKKNNRIIKQRKPVKVMVRQSELDNQQVMQALLSDPLHPEDLETGEELLFCRPGIQARTFKKLRRGLFSINAELDLHGMTVDQARNALAAFLDSCQSGPGYCVRIIHGKGLGSVDRLPVLKGMVNHWLRQRREVLAFCTARNDDGGSGAVYVLLKRKR